MPGIAELLKRQQCLDMVWEQAFNIPFLTETEATSYFTCNSQGHFFIINGPPKTSMEESQSSYPPQHALFVKDVFQRSSRIPHIVRACQSGDCHSIGVYAPHDKLEYDTVKEAFWLLLQAVLDKSPLPELVYILYILGDFNVRLQSRKKSEHEVLDSHVYGRGSQYAQVDPFGFQALDTVRRKWLPSVTQSRCNHGRGCPSDHFLLQASVRVT